MPVGVPSVRNSLSSLACSSSVSVSSSVTVAELETGIPRLDPADGANEIDDVSLAAPFEEAKRAVDI